MSATPNTQRPEPAAHLSRSGAPIVHDVTSLFVAHADNCTTCTRQAEPCRDGAAIVSNFVRTSASYFKQYTA